MQPCLDDISSDNGDDDGYDSEHHIVAVPAKVFSLTKPKKKGIISFGKTEIYRIRGTSRSCAARQGISCASQSAESSGFPSRSATEACAGAADALRVSLGRAFCRSSLLTVFLMASTIVGPSSVKVTTQRQLFLATTATFFSLITLANTDWPLLAFSTLIHSPNCPSSKAIPTTSTFTTPALLVMITSASLTTM